MARMLARAVLLAALLSLGERAQAQAVLCRSGGVLGSSVTYDLEGTPITVFALLPSLTTGPTPLSIVEPGSTLLLDVGIDLLDLLEVSLLDGLGKASVVYPIPLQLSLQGMPLHAQFIELPLAPTTFGDISNLTSFTMAEADTSVPTLGPQANALEGHTATVLDDGRVLIAGGTATTGPSAGMVLDEVELYDPKIEAFLPSLAALQDRRSEHVAVKLADGRVLITGGVDENGAVLKSAEIFDPITETTSAVPDMADERAYHTATLLPNGRVFVAGGFSVLSSMDLLGSLTSAVDSTELYDPGTNTWIPGPALPEGRAAHGASLLGDGRVLITGGLEVGTVFGIPAPELSSDCRRYDPATNTLLATASFSGERLLHGQVTLNNGDVLIGGGAGGSVLLLSFCSLASTRVYDTAANSWSNTANLNVARSGPNLVNRVSDIVCIGGAMSPGSLFTGQAGAADVIEIASQSVFSWTMTGMTLQERVRAVSVDINCESILTTGSGDNGTPITDTLAELFRQQ